MKFYYIISILGGLLLIFLFTYWRMKKWLDTYVASYQTDLLNRHFEEVENIYKQMRGWKHDYHNHIQVMMAYIEMDRVDEMKGHLSELLDDITSIDHVLKTGNVMVDAILNSKISLMRASHIEVNAKASVPEKHSLLDIDLCAIIGNLLDNAMEGAQKVPESERFVRIYIRPMKGQLYISVTNATLGIISKSFLSSKRGNNHGFGLKRVDQLVEKYGGFVNRQVEEGVFATEVALPFVLES